MFTLFFLTCALLVLYAGLNRLANGFEIGDSQVAFPLILFVVLVAWAYVSFSWIDLELWKWMAEQ